MATVQQRTIYNHTYVQFVRFAACVAPITEDTLIAANVAAADQSEPTVEIMNASAVEDWDEWPIYGVSGYGSVRGDQCYECFVLDGVKRVHNQVPCNYAQ